MTDKQQHFLGGFCIAIVVAAVAGFAGLWTVLAAVFGLIAATAVGVWKEFIYDAARPATHTVDVKDLVATVAGGVGGFAAFLFLNALSVKIFS